MVDFFWQKTSLENFKICLQIWQLIVKRYPLTMQKSIESCPLKEAWQNLYMNMLMSRSISTCLSPCPCTCSCLCSCSCVIFAISVSWVNFQDMDMELDISIYLLNWLCKIDTDAILNLEICILRLAWNLKMKIWISVCLLFNGSGPTEFSTDIFSTFSTDIRSCDELWSKSHIFFPLQCSCVQYSSSLNKISILGRQKERYCFSLTKRFYTEIKI
jgi:hypothetical protein